MNARIRKVIDELVEKGGPEDFLEDAVKIYEYDEDGNKASDQYIINGLYHEAEKFFELQEEYKKNGWD